MPKQQSQKLLAGAGILAASGLIAKILSAVYRVPFQNVVGNTGFYVYQQVYPIYGIGMVLALSGWPLFISKIITEQPDEEHQELVARRLFWSLLGISAMLFAVFFGLAPQWALLMGGDMRLTPVVSAVSWMFWLMPFLAVGRGFAQGRQNMVPTATSQVVEQIVRVTVILVAAFWAVHHDWSVYKMGAWTTFSATIAGLAATLFLTGSLRQVWRTPIAAPARQSQDISWGRLIKRLLSEGGLLAMLAAILVLMQLVDSFSVKVLLEQYGLSAGVAEATKGVYDRGQPMVQLGMVIATGLGTSLLPALRLHFIQGDQKAFKQDFQLTMRLSLLLSAVAAVGLIAVMPVVNQMLFGSREGSVALAWFVASIVPATLVTVTTSVLQSLDRTRGIGWLILLTLVIKYYLNDWLVPELGITGASLATAVALLPMLVVTMVRIPHEFWREMATVTWYIKALGLLAAVGGIAYGFRLGGDALLGMTRLASVGTTAVAVLAGIGVFVVLLWQLRLLSVTEWAALPKGDKIYTLLNRGNEDALG